MRGSATDPEVLGAALASELAAALGLRRSNLWEPPVARKIALRLRAGEALADLRSEYRERLGLGLHDEGRDCGATRGAPPFRSEGEPPRR